MSYDVEKLKKDLDKQNTSLTQKISDLKGKIEKMRKFKDSTILCDVSGSMDSHVSYEKGSQRAIDVVLGVLENFAGANFYEFSTHCKKVSRVTDTPNSGTNMGGAFLKVSSDGIKEIILLTDGAPDSEQHALDAAKQTKLKINIIYIGPAPTPPFLTSLANINGGVFTSVELIKAGANKELETKIRGLLGT